METMPNLDFLSEEERTKILSVLKRDDSVRKNQDSKIIQIRQEIQTLRQKSILKSGDDLTKMCARCHEAFGFLFNRGDICPKCKFKVCKLCQEIVFSGGMLCVFCYKQRQLKLLLSQSNQGKFGRRSSGSDLIKASMKLAIISNGADASSENAPPRTVNNTHKDSPAIKNGTAFSERHHSKSENERFPKNSDRRKLTELFDSFKSSKSNESQDEKEEVSVKRVTTKHYDSDSDSSSSASEDEMPSAPVMSSTVLSSPSLSGSREVTASKVTHSQSENDAFSKKRDSSSSIQNSGFHRKRSHDSDHSDEEPFSKSSTETQIKVEIHSDSSSVDKDINEPLTSPVYKSHNVRQTPTEIIMSKKVIRKDSSSSQRSTSPEILENNHLALYRQNHLPANGSNSPYSFDSLPSSHANSPLPRHRLTDIASDSQSYRDSSDTDSLSRQSGGTEYSGTESQVRTTSQASTGSENEDYTVEELSKVRFRRMSKPSLMASPIQSQSPTSTTSQLDQDWVGSGGGRNETEGTHDPIISQGIMGNTLGEGHKDMVIGRSQESGQNVSDILVEDMGDYVNIELMSWEPEFTAENAHMTEIANDKFELNTKFEKSLGNQNKDDLHTESQLAVTGYEEKKVRLLSSDSVVSDSLSSLNDSCFQRTRLFSTDPQKHSDSESFNFSPMTPLSTAKTEVKSEMYTFSFFNDSVCGNESINSLKIDIDKMKPSDDEEFDKLFYKSISYLEMDETQDMDVGDDDFRTNVMSSGRTAPPEKSLLWHFDDNSIEDDFNVLFSPEVGQLSYCKKPVCKTYSSTSVESDALSDIEEESEPGDDMIERKISNVNIAAENEILDPQTRCDIEQSEKTRQVSVVEDGSLDNMLSEINGGHMVSEISHAHLENHVIADVGEVNDNIKTCKNNGYDEIVHSSSESHGRDQLTMMTADVTIHSSESSSVADIPHVEIENETTSAVSVETSLTPIEISLTQAETNEIKQISNQDLVASSEISLKSEYEIGANLTSSEISDVKLNEGTKKLQDIETTDILKKRSFGSVVDLKETSATDEKVRSVLSSSDLDTTESSPKMKDSTNGVLEEVIQLQGTINVSSQEVDSFNMSSDEIHSAVSEMSESDIVSDNIETLSKARIATADTVEGVLQVTTEACLPHGMVNSPTVTTDLIEPKSTAVDINKQFNIETCEIKMPDNADQPFFVAETMATDVESMTSFPVPEEFQDQGTNEELEMNIPSESDACRVNQNEELKLKPSGDDLTQEADTDLEINAPSECRVNQNEQLKLKLSGDNLAQEADTDLEINTPSKSIVCSENQNEVLKLNLNGDDILTGDIEDGAETNVCKEIDRFDLDGDFDIQASGDNENELQREVVVSDTPGINIGKALVMNTLGVAGIEVIPAPPGFTDSDNARTDSEVSPKTSPRKSDYGDAAPSPRECILADLSREDYAQDCSTLVGIECDLDLDTVDTPGEQTLVQDSNLKDNSLKEEEMQKSPLPLRQKIPGDTLVKHWLETEVRTESDVVMVTEGDVATDKISTDSTKHKNNTYGTSISSLSKPVLNTEPAPYDPENQVGGESETTTNFSIDIPKINQPDDKDSGRGIPPKLSPRSGSEGSGSLEDSGHVSGASTQENTPEHHRTDSLQSQLSVPSTLSTVTDREDEEDDADIDDLVARHKSNSYSRYGNLLSAIADSRESIVSFYSNAGEVDYGKIPVTGEIQFGLDYNYRTGTLEIYIKQCKDLAPVDTKRKRSDPYVKTYLLPDKTRSGKRKTKVKKHTLSPTFEETLRYLISKSELENRTLWVTVWHSDRFGRNDFLGEVTINFDYFRFSDSSPKWYTLQERFEAPSGPMLTYKGDLIISLRYVPPDKVSGEKKISPNKKKLKRSSRPDTGPMGELHVTVKEARNLTAIRSNGTSDPFCKGYLLPDKHRSNKQKTPIVRQNCNPMWNHTFVFDEVSIQDLRDRALELTIWDYDKISSNDFLGGVRLNLGIGRSYGKTVDWMDARGEEISMWQAMLDRPNMWIDGSLILRPNMDKRKF